MLVNAWFARLSLPSGQHGCCSSTCAGNFASCCQLGIGPNARPSRIAPLPLRNCSRWILENFLQMPSQMHTQTETEAGGTSDTRLHIHPRLLPHCFAWVRLRTAAIKTPWSSDLSAGRCKQGGGQTRLRPPCRILSSRPRRQPWQLQGAGDHSRRHLKAELACDPSSNLQLQCGTRSSQAHVVYWHHTSLPCL